MKKEIPIKNYIILFVIFIVSVTLTYYLTNFYNFEKNDSHYYISEVIKEIKIDELPNYIVENNANIILVVCECDNYNQIDKKIKKYILNNDIKSELVYVVLNNNNYNSLKQSINLDVVKQSNLLYIENGVISDILYEEKKDLVYEDFKTFIEGKTDEI